MDVKKGEHGFAKLLDGASDVKAFSKLPEGSLRHRVHRPRHESLLVLPGLRRGRTERNALATRNEGRRRLRSRGPAGGRSGAPLVCGDATALTGVGCAT